MADNSYMKGLELAVNDIIANLKIMDEYASSDSDYLQAHKMSCLLQRGLDLSLMGSMQLVTTFQMV